MAYAVGAGSGVFTAEQIAKLEEGTRQLVDEMSQQYRAKIAELTEQVAHMEKLRSYPQGNDKMVDTRLGKPITFDGDELKWAEFSFKYRAYAANLKEDLGEALDKIEDNNLEEQDYDLMDDRMRENARQVYFSLTMLLSGTPLGIVKKTKRSNGLEAYRMLSKRYNPQSKGRNLARLWNILNAKFGDKKHEFMDKLTSWEQEIEEYEAVTEDKISDAVRCAVVSERSPDEVSKHLLLNAATVTHYSQMRKIVEEYLLAGKKWTKAEDDNAMEVDHLYQKGRGGKKGTKGKKGKKGSGKGKNGKGKKGEQYQNEQHYQEKFEGYCGICGKWGHRQRDCWSAGGKKGSGKGGKNGDAHQQGGTVNQIDATPAVAPPVAAAPTTAGPANGTVGCITSGEHEGWIFTCAEDPSTTITLSSAAFQVNEHEGSIQIGRAHV